MKHKTGFFNNYVESLENLKKENETLKYELQLKKQQLCENCNKILKCTIFKKIWKDKLRKEGYLISAKEFGCLLYESKF